MWDAQDILYACENRLNGGYILGWRKWHPALRECVCLTVSLRRADILCGNYSLCVPVSVAGWFSCSILPTPCLTRPLTAGDPNTALQQAPLLMGYQGWRTSTKEEKDERINK